MIQLFDAGTAEYFGLIIRIFFPSVALFALETLELTGSGSFIIAV